MLGLIWIQLFDALMVMKKSADELSKQFGPRSAQTEHWAKSGSKMFDTGSIPERIYEKSYNFEKFK